MGRCPRRSATRRGAYSGTWTICASGRRPTRRKSSSGAGVKGPTGVSLAQTLVESVEPLWREQTLVAQRAEVGPRFFGIAAGLPDGRSPSAAGVAFLGPRQRRSESVVQELVAATRGRLVADVAQWLSDGGS